MRKNIKKQNKNKKRNVRRTGYGLTKLSAFSNFESPTIGFVDPHKFIEMKYSDVFSLTLTTMTAGSQVMNLNSLFDPDRTGTGHQPYGYDTLATIYNRYRVWRVSWKITFHAESQGFHIVVLPSNGALATAITNAASFSLACESPRSQVGSQGTGANAVIKVGNLALNDLNGTTEDEYKGDDRFQALFGASPSELLLLNIGCYNTSGSTLALDFIVELKYYTEVHDPFMLAQS